ncbi:hypothetical protein ALP05_00671 [Pseudomonas caricapapayae]|uniref:Uncharacterized protein n=1 Tax=Pseudomonas caricapapayae TaxID=46678 RepID=A0A3M6F770_9PSED|nr:hypothetical protein [Pseudomonas caricapapayae]RMV76452.1 hypothetical protein ALP05_00671 [Pseudomonas caricapapayae]
MNEHELNQNQDSLPNLNFSEAESQAKFPEVDFGVFEREEEKRKVVASSTKVIDALQITLNSVEDKAKAFSANLFASGFADQLKRLQAIDTALSKHEVGKQPVEQYELSTTVYSQPLHEPAPAGNWTAGIGVDDEQDEEERLEEGVASMVEVDTNDGGDSDLFQFFESRTHEAESAPDSDPEPVLGLDDDSEPLEASVTHTAVAFEPVDTWDEIQPDETAEVVQIDHGSEDLTVPVQDDSEPVYESVLPPADVTVPEHIQAHFDEVAPFLSPSPVDETQEPGGDAKAFDAAVFAPVRPVKPMPTPLDRQIRHVEKAHQLRLTVTAKPEFMSETANARRKSLAERSYQARIESLNIMKDLTNQTDALKSFLENNDMAGAAAIIKLLNKAENLKAQAELYDRLREELVLGSYKKAFKD